MLSLYERYLFILFAVLCVVAAYNTFYEMILVIGRGQGTLGWDKLPQRLVKGALALFTQGRIIRHRKLSSFFHLLIAYAFIFFLAVNGVDVLRGFTDFNLSQLGLFGNLVAATADILSVLGLVGMGWFLIRRFLLQDPALKTRANVLLHPDAADGVRRDSLIVGLFLFLHLGFRFLGESFHIAAHGADPWQPLANIMALAWAVLKDDPPMP